MYINSTSNMYRAYNTIKSCKVLTCTILCGLPELNYVTGFNDLVQKIIECRVGEKCKQIEIFFDFEANYLSI